jgi:hypothetical protein
MSWNAAKRVLSYGYPNVVWYPEGTDGWQRANLPVADSQPDRGQVRGVISPLTTVPAGGDRHACGLLHLLLDHAAEGK